VCQAIPFIEEVGFGMGWRDASVVGMTWLYFDESGEHGPNGWLRRFTLGCPISTFEQWKALDAKWRPILVDAGIDEVGFHMADFEAKAPPYDNWSDEKRKNVLNALLDIASEHVPIFCGFNDLAADLKDVKDLQRAYQKNLIKAFKEIVLRIDEFVPGPINLVFARHKNISAQRIGMIFDHFSYWLGDRAKFGGFGEPKALPQLQVADIVAYEFSRTSRQKRPDAERYPLKQLASRAKMFTLYDSSRLEETQVWGHEFPLPLRRILEK
jgi:hypothetical protein